MAEKMLIVAPCFSREEPWELEDSEGYPRWLWMQDAAFQHSIDTRRVSIRAGSTLEFESGGEGIQQVLAFWEPIKIVVNREQCDGMAERIDVAISRWAGESRHDLDFVLYLMPSAEAAITGVRGADAGGLIGVDDNAIADRICSLLYKGEAGHDY